MPTQADIQALMSKTLRQATEHESKLGPLGVDATAQKLFDALAKGCTCAWRGNTILVFGEVIIEPPYTKARPLILLLCSNMALILNLLFLNRSRKIASRLLRLLTELNLFFPKLGSVLVSTSKNTAILKEG